MFVCIVQLCVLMYSYCSIRTVTAVGSLLYMFVCIVQLCVTCVQLLQHLDSDCGRQIAVHVCLYCAIVCTLCTVTAVSGQWLRSADYSMSNNLRHYICDRMFTVRCLIRLNSSCSCNIYPAPFLPSPLTDSTECIPSAATRDTSMFYLDTEGALDLWMYVIKCLIERERFVTVHPNQLK